MPSRALRPIILSALVLLIYLPTLGHGFVNLDDPGLILENPFFKPLTLSNVLRAWSESYKHLYIPLTYTVWGTILAVAGEAPWAFHLVNVLVFLCSVLLVFQILNLLVEDEWAAFAGAVLFAVHPTQVELVAWVTSLKSSLCGMFCLATVACHLKFRRSEEMRWYIAGTVFFMLALLSKTTAVIVPLWLWVLDTFLAHRKAGRALVEQFPYWALALVFSAIASSVYPDPAIATQGVWQRLVVSLDATTLYLVKLCFPFPLSVDYGRVPDEVMNSYGTFLTAGFPVLGGLALRWHYRRTRQKRLVVPVLLFLTALLPTIGLKPHDMQNVTTICDRYLSLSLVGAALALAWGLSSIKSEWKKPALGVLGAVGLGFVIVSALQSRNWRSTEALWEHTLAVNPRSWLAYNNIGSSFEMKKDYARAAEFYAKAAAIHPSGEIYNNLGAVNLYREEPRLAAEAFQRAIEAEPSGARLYNNLGIALKSLGMLGEAELAFKKAVELEPGFTQARANLESFSRR